MSQENRKSLSVSAGVASVSVASILVALKIWALAATGSLSIAASLADSALDLIMSLGGLAAIIYAAKPPDEDHAFGHTSAEDLAALAQSVFILISAVAIGYSAVGRLLAKEPPALMAEERGMAVIGISILVTLALVLWQQHVIRKTGNRIVRADQMHYLTDLLPNIGAMFALWASAQFGLVQIDSLVALGAAMMLAFGALRIGHGAWDALMDRRADPELIAGIAEITEGWPGVMGFHDLKTRMAGSRVFVYLHIELDGDQTLYDAHEIGASLRRKIMQTYPEVDLIIHKDPAWRTGPDASGGDI